MFILTWEKVVLDSSRGAQQWDTSTIKKSSSLQFLQFEASGLFPL